MHDAIRNTRISQFPSRIDVESLRKLFTPAELLILLVFTPPSSVFPLGPARTVCHGFRFRTKSLGRRAGMGDPEPSAPGLMTLGVGGWKERGAHTSRIKGKLNITSVSLAHQLT